MAKKKTEKLKEFIDELEGSKKEIALKLYQRLVFMDKTLTKLEETIEEHGATIKDVNGNGFEVFQEHPATKSYNNMIGKYNSVMKTLIDVFPSNIKYSDDFLDFVDGKK